MTRWRRKMKLKKTLSIAVVFALLLEMSATQTGNLLNSWNGQEIFLASEAGRDQAKEELNDVKEQLENLEGQYDDVEGQLSEKAEALSDLLADQEILENDIAETQIIIDQTKVDLENANLEEREAYDAMMLRIQYMYENSTLETLWDAIINAKGFADLLNRVEYITQVHNTDRMMLEDYKAIVEEIEVLAAELDAEMNDLVTLQEVYEHQEVELENAMAALEAEAADFQEQITAAEKRAKELAEYIEEQNRLIAEKKRQEELRREQERQEKLRQEQLRQQQLQQQQNNSNNGGSKKPSTSGGYLTDSSYDPAFSSNVSGSELVSYALQFVGNPYVWGGNSLTKGCDCSGFVNQVYKKFGFSMPRYSQAFKSVGQPVAFENIKAGDIVVYPGHVAIYIGNGRIVEAQSSKAGITSNRSVTCNTITAIRRVL